MKRIDIFYGGRHYSVGGRKLAELREEVTELVQRGGGWIDVNYGEGSMAAAQLFVAPGVDIALLPVPGDESGEPESGDPEPGDPEFGDRES